MNRRQIRLTHHPIELSYLRLVLFAMLGPALFVTGCLYYLTWQTVAQELALPELIAGSLIPAFRQVNQLILWSMPLMFGGILFFAVRLAHRFAGPLERIETDLETMIKSGNFSKPIRTRRGDTLAPLVEKINQAIRLSRSE